MAVQKHNRRKASLELGRLTEELLPVQHLQEILRSNVPHAKIIQPLQWYYSNVYVQPIWDNDTLIYHATLPFVRENTFIHCQFHSWSKPLNNTAISAQVLVKPGLVLDTLSGSIFVPSKCQGINPTVCYGGPKLDQEVMACEVGILLKREDFRKQCIIKLSKNIQKTSFVQEIVKGEFVLVTMGELVSTHCKRKTIFNEFLNSRVYLMTVPQQCALSGKIG